METRKKFYDRIMEIERMVYHMASWIERLKDLFVGKQKASGAPEPMELLEQMGYTVQEQEDGSLAIERDGRVLLLNYEPATKAKIRYRQETPYLVLFSYTNGSYFVNDGNETGYVALLEQLTKVRNAPALLEAATAFLKAREVSQEK